MKYSGRACILLICMIVNNAMGMRIGLQSLHYKTIGSFHLRHFNNPHTHHTHHHQAILKIIQLRKDNFQAQKELEEMRINGEELTRSHEYRYYHQSIKKNEHEIRRHLDTIGTNFSLD
jgi:hypothetical protein